MKYPLAALALMLLLAPHHASANMGFRIYPQRLVIDSNTRKATMTVSNIGEKTSTFRIDLNNRRMLQDGSFETAETPLEGELFADENLRIAPRRLTLGPGESQDIRLMFRKSKDMQDGEYRTNMWVRQLPPRESNTDKKLSGDKVSLSVRPNLVYSIPIFIYNGSDLGYEVAINDDISIVPPKEEGQPPKAKFSITRSGKISPYGDITLYHVNNGSETEIGSWGGLAVYSPLKQRDFEVDLNKLPNNYNVSGGKLKLTYNKRKDQGGDVIATKVVALTN